MIRFEDGSRTALSADGASPSSRAARGPILIAGHGDETDALADGLRGLNEEPVVFDTFSRALEASERIRPDTVLVGSEASAGDGLRFIYNVLRAVPDTIVIALTGGIDALETDLAIAAGAHDVLHPPHSARAVLLRRQVVKGTARDRGSSRRDVHRRVGLGHLVIDLASRQVLDGTDPLTLSGREFELLVRLMEARGEVVSRERLLRDIWGEDQGSTAVLDATVHRLRRRLEEKLPDDDVVTTVRGVGYRLEAPGPAPA